jgi:hypothetical protein
MRKAILALGLLLSVGMLAPCAARAGGVSVAIGLPGFGLFVGGPPVVVAPPPVAFVPPPVVYGASVYAAPVYLRPYGRPYYGRRFHGGRGWHHGHR